MGGPPRAVGGQRFPRTSPSRTRVGWARRVNHHFRRPMDGHRQGSWRNLEVIFPRPSRPTSIGPIAFFGRCLRGPLLRRGRRSCIPNCDKKLVPTAVMMAGAGFRVNIPRRVSFLGWPMERPAPPKVPSTGQKDRKNLGHVLSKAVGQRSFPRVFDGPKKAQDHRDRAKHGPARTAGRARGLFNRQTGP